MSLSLSIASYQRTSSIAFSSKFTSNHAKCGSNKVLTIVEGSKLVNMALCVNSGPGTGFRVEYHFSHNAWKSVLRAALLFRVYLEFLRNELKYLLYSHAIVIFFLCLFLFKSVDFTTWKCPLYLHALFLFFSASFFLHQLSFCLLSYWFVSTRINCYFTSSYFLF